MASPEFREAYSIDLNDQKLMLMMELLRLSGMSKDDVIASFDRGITDVHLEKFI